jgi:2,4-dienoyl-CoA reductase-like NADH-dependent reductase (Old Yellow Enzyme family)
VPRPLTNAEVKDVAYRFGYAAKMLHDAGADGVELHGGHGYL